MFITLHSQQAIGGAIARTIHDLKTRRPDVIVVDNTHRYARHTPYELFLRYQAQSILTGLIDDPYLPHVDAAREIIAWAARNRA